MSKPLIRIHRHRNGKASWLCSTDRIGSDGVYGFGDTPERAYWDYSKMKDVTTAYWAKNA